MAANRDYSLLTFSQQLRLLTAALDSKDPKRIARYLIPFALLYDPETKCEEIRKNGATIKRSPLLDHVVDNLVNAKPLIFLKYLRILVQVGTLEVGLVWKRFCVLCNLAQVCSMFWIGLHQSSSNSLQWGQATSVCMQGFVNGPGKRCFVIFSV